MNETKTAAPPRRCTAERMGRGPMAVISVFGGQVPKVRCREPEGHEGKHHGWYSPFPGFCDEHVWWS